jgi:hypothetical protein
MTFLQKKAGITKTVILSLYQIVHLLAATTLNILMLIGHLIVVYWFDIVVELC